MEKGDESETRKRMPLRRFAVALLLFYLFGVAICLVLKSCTALLEYTSFWALICGPAITIASMILMCLGINVAFRRLSRKT